MAASHSVDPDRWRVLLDDAMARIAGRFRRVEPRTTARAFVTGLMSDIERKTCWSLAERAGHARPDAMQRLLRSARWDEDQVRDDVRDLAIEHLGHRDGVLIVDETGFLKKGLHSVGVQRQYTGTAGRIENAQVGVFLAYASPHGRALVDRRLYLPRDTWCDDPQRRETAKVPAETVFATKPALAREMIRTALDAGVPAKWVTGDEVYGQDPSLRTELEARKVGYVLAVSCAARVRINDGRTTVRADTAAAQLPETAWQTRSAGAGAKGPRHYQWAWIALDGDGCRRQLLVRRNQTTGELAFYRCFTPKPTSLATLVRVAGARWSIEELFQTAKSGIGLDHYQVRNYTSWHRHITLTMLALAILAVIAATTTSPSTHHGSDDHLPEPGPINLTVNEIRHLLGALVLCRSPHPIKHILHWSSWRRHHQAQARQSHYQRRLNTR